MKRFVLVLVALLIGFSASAQIMPTDNDALKAGMKYRELKKIYDFRDYTNEEGQRYRPAGLGVASFFIPGLGEMISGEGWRGTAFLGGWLLGHYVALTGIYELSDAIYYTGVAGAIVTRVISTIDATRVGKVKNMYNRDLKGRYAFDMDVYPSVNYVRTADGIQPTTGLTFALKF